MEFLNNKANQCPRCKCEHLTKQNDSPEADNAVIAICENCKAKFTLFTTNSNENSEK